MNIYFILSGTMDVRMLYNILFEIRNGHPWPTSISNSNRKLNNTLTMTDISFVVKRSFNQNYFSTADYWLDLILRSHFENGGNVINANYFYVKRENLHWIFGTPFIHPFTKETMVTEWWTAWSIYHSNLKRYLQFYAIAFNYYMLCRRPSTLKIRRIFEIGLKFFPDLFSFLTAAKKKQIKSISMFFYTFISLIFI